MISIKIKNKKVFMSRLLASELFDSYLVEEAEITTFNTFHIDGKVHKDFYKDDAFGDLEDGQQLGSYSSWKELKPICFDLIKGKRTPLSFKFVFYLSEAEKEKLLEAADAGIAKDQVKLGLNIRFSASELYLTTGCAISIFTLDKSIEKAWDNYIPSFLDSNNIENEIM